MAKTTRSVKGQDKLERTQKRGAKRLKGFIAWQAEAKELGANLSDLPRCGPERALAMKALVPMAANQVIARKGSGELLPAHLQRTAVQTGLAPLERKNTKARPVATAWRAITKHGRALQPASGRAKPLMALAISAGKLGREYEDWSAEYALVELRRRKGNICTLHAPATGTVTIRLDDGRPGRVRLLDLVTIGRFDVPAGWAEAALADLGPIWPPLANDFHMKWHEHDPCRELGKTIEFGWSGFPGDAEVQREAHEQGVPYKLKAWKDERGAKWVEDHLDPILRHMWLACCNACADECDQMKWRGLADEYGLCETGFNKVTVGWNTPTLLHYDDRNEGLTALLIVGLHELRGGAHVLFGCDLHDAIVVEHVEGVGVLIIGDYKRCLHGNLSTIAGDRLVVNAYSSARLVSRLFEY